MRINPLLVDTGSPPIPEVQAWRAGYGGQAGPLIDLSQAVPGYPPHPEMLRHLADAAGSPLAAQYGDILGDRTLREAYARHVSAIYGAAIAPEETLVTAGCNQAFFVAMMALARAGDAILLPSPWYFNHAMALDMLGIEARALPCAAEQAFVPDPVFAETLIDERVRAIVLVTPNNPTGATYTPAVIEAFAELCRRRGIWLVIDETYRDFLPPDAGPPHGLLQRPDWGASIVQLYSFSKSYCIPGHRVGALSTGTDLIAQIAKIQDTLQICAPRVGQMALSWAIDALVDWRAGNAVEIAARTDAFRAAMAGANGWSVDAIGAYFAYVRHPFEGVRAADVAERLATERGAICLPGSYFGAGQEGHLRIAFANAGVDALSDLTDRLRGLPAER
jgi:aspartate/methionine/tyrosine aminotransferase